MTILLGSQSISEAISAMSDAPPGEDANNAVIKSTLFVFSIILAITRHAIEQPTNRTITGITNDFKFTKSALLKLDPIRAPAAI